MCETKENWINRIAGYAVESMLYEVAATPKPGLVDRANNGAHQDMDFFTFMSSAGGLHRCFDEMTAAGLAGSEEEPEALFQKLREIGKGAEESMFAFTGGVNTHKGMIFSLGLLCGSLGYFAGNKHAEELCRGLWEEQKHTEENDEKKVLRESDKVCLLAGKICEDLVKKDFEGIGDKPKALLTKGEKMYLEYGYKGVRGVAEGGYAVVRERSLPVYEQLRNSGVPLNDALVHTLLYLIAETEDTNIVSRHDKKMAAYAQQYAMEAIWAGGMLSDHGRVCIQEMDAEFIEKNISPGGCADLLAVTHFLYRINQAAYRKKLLPHSF